MMEKWACFGFCRDSSLIRGEGDPISLFILSKIVVFCPHSCTFKVCIQGVQNCVFIKKKILIGYVLKVTFHGEGGGGEGGSGIKNDFPFFL